MIAIPAGIGSDETASSLCATLIKRGASVNVTSRWLGVAPVHVAAMYACPGIIGTLARANPKGGEVVGRALFPSRQGTH